MNLIITDTNFTHYLYIRSVGIESDAPDPVCDLPLALGWFIGGNGGIPVEEDLCTFYSVNKHCEE